jgi:hypothetical protein
MTMPGNKDIFLLLVTAFLSLLLVSSGCEKTPVLDCFMSTGEIIKEERQVGQFSAVVLKDNVNLVLIQSNSNRLVVEGGKNLMRNIVTEVENDSVLTISNDNRCNWVRSYDKPITVFLEFRQLESLEYRSVGDVVNEDTLILDSLSLDVREGAGKINLKINTPLIYCSLHYGTADIVLEGNAELGYIFGDGFGRIDNRDFLVSQAFVTNRSSNDMYLSVETRLGATIENIGNIYYRGNPPDVGLNQIGTGQLIKID